MDSGTPSPRNAGDVVDCGSVEDAVAAAKAAVEEGIVAGGGSALVHARKALKKLQKSLSGDEASGVEVFSNAQPEWIFNTGFAIPLLGLAGVLLLTSLMHLARGIGRLHAMFAKSMLVARAASGPAEAAEPKAALATH